MSVGGAWPANIWCTV